MSEIFEISQQEIIDGKWERILNFFRRRSIWLLYYCTGCGAIELPPTMTSRNVPYRIGWSWWGGARWRRSRYSNREAR